MIEADDAGDFPGVAVFSPDHDKLESAALVFAILFVAETVLSDLNRPEVLDGRISLDVSENSQPKLHLCDIPGSSDRGQFACHSMRGHLSPVDLSP